MFSRHEIGTKKFEVSDSAKFTLQLSAVFFRTLAIYVMVNWLLKKTARG
jgi:hypothetical protein